MTKIKRDLIMRASSWDAFIRAAEARHMEQQRLEQEERKWQRQRMERMARIAVLGLPAEEAILAALRHCGPCSLAELSAAIGVEPIPHFNSWAARTPWYPAERGVQNLRDDGYTIEGDIKSGFLLRKRAWQGAD